MHAVKKTEWETAWEQGYISSAYQLVQQRVYECSVVCQRNQEGPRPQEAFKFLHVGVQLCDHLLKEVFMHFCHKEKYSTFV